MEQIMYKYNRNYLESICRDFSQCVLQMLQEQLLDTGELKLSAEEKEQIVGAIIKMQTRLVDQLFDKQKMYGDVFIDFFQESDVQKLFACYSIGRILGLQEASEYAAQNINEAWQTRWAIIILERKKEEANAQKQK